MHRSSLFAFFTPKEGSMNDTLPSFFLKKNTTRALLFIKVKIEGIQLKITDNNSTDLPDPSRGHNHVQDKEQIKNKNNYDDT
jgi:hypothetical protein